MQPSHEKSFTLLHAKSGHSFVILPNSVTGFERFALLLCGGFASDARAPGLSIQVVLGQEDALDLSGDGFVPLAVPGVPDSAWAPRAHVRTVLVGGEVWLSGGMTGEGYYDNSLLRFDVREAVRNVTAFGRQKTGASGKVLEKLDSQQPTGINERQEESRGNSSFGAICLGGLVQALLAGKRLVDYGFAAIARIEPISRALVGVMLSVLAENYPDVHEQAAEAFGFAQADHGAKVAEQFIPTPSSEVPVRRTSSTQQQPASASSTPLPSGSGQHGYTPQFAGNALIVCSLVVFLWTKSRIAQFVALVSCFYGYTIWGAHPPGEKNAGASISPVVRVSSTAGAAGGMTRISKTVPVEAPGRVKRTNGRRVFGRRRFASEESDSSETGQEETVLVSGSQSLPPRGVLSENRSSRSSDIFVSLVPEGPHESSLPPLHQSSAPSTATPATLPSRSPLTVAVPISPTDLAVRKLKEELSATRVHLETLIRVASKDSTSSSSRSGGGLGGGGGYGSLYDDYLTAGTRQYPGGGSGGRYYEDELLYGGRGGGGRGGGYGGGAPYGYGGAGGGYGADVYGGYGGTSGVRRSAVFLQHTGDMSCRTPQCSRDFPQCRTGGLGCCSDLMFVMLADVCEVLEHLGIPYFLLYGTLLGAVRDQDIIPHTQVGRGAGSGHHSADAGIGDLLFAELVQYVRRATTAPYSVFW